jgi:translation elongation factor EF-1alpha
VDKSELRKLESEAKEQKRESWYLAYIMDINKEERSKGKTVEVPLFTFLFLSFFFPFFSKSHLGW